MKVIVTRPSPDAEAFAAEISRLGAEPILSPVMAIRIRKAPVDLEGIGALAFTSANGVRAFCANSSDRDCPVFAVGEATAAAVRAAGFADVRAASGDVESLAALIAEAKPSLSVLHLAGSERAGDLAALLAESGVAARRAVLYDAEKIARFSPEAEEALAKNPRDAAVVLFSPRSARLFLEQAASAGLTEKLRDALALCLSAEVAAALGGSAWRRIEIAAERTGEAMAQLVVAALSGRKGRNGSPR
jgi:uroporphyrinogen-III synthase